MTHGVYITGIADAVQALGGRGSVAGCVGVTPAAVSNAVTRGKFPSDWFLALRQLGAARGVYVPDNLFNFRDPVPLGAPGARDARSAQARACPETTRPEAAE